MEEGLGAPQKGLSKKATIISKENVSLAEDETEKKNYLQTKLTRLCK